MIEGNKKIIENIKTGIIVVLMLSTILLLYFFWSDKTFEDITIYTQTPVKATLPTEVIVPNRIEVSFGGGVYALLPMEKSSIWNSDEENSITMTGEFEIFSNAANIVVEEISEDQYNQVMSYQSITAEFDYPLNFSGLCKAYNIKWASSYDTIETITSMGYSEYSKESLFVCERQKKKYYRIFSDDKDNTRLSQLISQIESKPYDVYYPMGTFLGNDSNVLIPDVLNMNMAKHPYQQELPVGETEKIGKAAQGFFGKSLDFIRKITEGNGAITYMYGYGEKVLIANTDGSLEYKEKIRGEEYVSKKQFEALDIALKYIASHGKWPVSQDLELQPYLKNIESVSGKQKGYTFTFGMQLNGQNLLYDQGEMVKITVIGEQVTYYKRNAMIVSQGSSGTVEVQAISAINMLVQNYETIYKSALEQQMMEVEPGEQIKTFEDLAKNIKKVDTGYFVNSNSQQGNKKIKPAWVVTVGEKDLYFDLYTNVPLE